MTATLAPIHNSGMQTHPTTLPTQKAPATPMAKATGRRQQVFGPQGGVLGLRRAEGGGYGAEWEKEE